MERKGWFGRLASRTDGNVNFSYVSLAAIVALGGIGGFQAIGESSHEVISEQTDAGSFAGGGQGGHNIAMGSSSQAILCMGVMCADGIENIDLGDAEEADLGDVEEGEDYGEAPAAQSAWDQIKGGFGRLARGLGSITDGILPGDGLHPLAVADGILPGEGFVGEDGFFRWVPNAANNALGAVVTMGPFAPLAAIPVVNGFMDAVLPGEGMGFTDIASGTLQAVGNGIDHILPGDGFFGEDGFFTDYWGIPVGIAATGVAFMAGGPVAALAVGAGAILVSTDWGRGFLDAVLPGEGIMPLDVLDGILPGKGFTGEEGFFAWSGNVVSQIPNAANHAAGAVMTMGPFAPLAAIPMVNGLVDRIMPGSGLSLTDIWSTEDGILHGLGVAGEWVGERTADYAQAKVEQAQQTVELVQGGIEGAREGIENAGEAVHEFSDASDTDGNINRALSDAVGTQMSSELSELGNHYRGGNEDAIRAAAKDWAADLSSAQIQDAIDALEDVQNGSGYETTQDFAGFVIDELQSASADAPATNGSDQRFQNMR